MNKLVAEHPLLQGRIETESSRLRAGSDALYTLGSVYDAAKRLFVGTAGRVREPGRFQDAEILERANRFLDLLEKARPEFGQASDADALEKLRAESILFSSTTLRVIAGAVYECVWKDPAGGTEVDDLVEPLVAVDFSPDARIWRNSGFVSPGRATPNARAQEVRAATQALVHALQQD